MNNHTYRKSMQAKVIGLVVGLLCSVGVLAANIEKSLEEYRNAGAATFAVERGDALWKQSVSVEGEERSCTTCHGSDLRQAGKHERTGKRIEPMAASANPQRFTDSAKVEKWFTRNCKWTMGRVCTPQEKGDILLYLNSR